MTGKGGLWAGPDDITEEIEFDTHERYALPRTRWFGISILSWHREEAHQSSKHYQYMIRPLFLEGAGGRWSADSEGERLP